ncbi:MAG: menaquinone-dependent protoporphyrinogen IX dehydrogenase [Zetaproteobacteria bacterium CG12_big_fil_rev_8_21_14_0_65_55_1124]|nr:MAG: protoporphyrinogen oxidase [Zetaproteobacteria bacterium CG1_02_55_237]PIS20395.1 MAG: menaquinone-dependent protoporphyrinogen IX dehydrogenase [Zetaproteobacteria bacterium CG08_land_8_20_14_0_20_55_17]PIW42591.1 MAG: menaquinone-dependent protoporphyrinogen IX dehydrogenase [Zetaproteobacteria bacterium CG12_big_fil_rev_8_21_14_0_65_55_1124]PIY54196.1 MAG: menaquinone-dependent protoporphyrinogen IX dehydrogenase [Zetaproteobacteria bacterium CG_4_10_14_0_8_um_filter_55_43]PIZ38374.1
MAQILILYSSTDGHTREICGRIQSIIDQHGHETRCISMNDAADIKLDGFDKIVVGASIRYGKHQKQVFDFVAHNEKLLASRPSAFFSVNVVARKAHKNQPDTNPYMLKFLKQVAWQPDALAVFAGKIDYKKYRFLDRQMIRLIMYLTHGPTHPDTEADFTDWEQVEMFGKIICGMQKKPAQ